MSLEFLYGDLDSKYRYYLFNQLNRGIIGDNETREKKGEKVSITDNFQKTQDTKGELVDSFAFKQQKLLKTLSPYKNIKATVVAIDSRYRLYYREERTIMDTGRTISSVSGEPTLITMKSRNSGYKNANSYKISLGTTFNNIFTVRLISSEIPNINNLLDGGGCCDTVEDRINNNSNCAYEDIPNDLHGDSIAGQLSNALYTESGVGDVGNCLTPSDWLEKSIVRTQDRINYIYLICPTLGQNILTPSGCVIENVFAKILMPSEAGTKYSFSTYVGDATKVFSPNTLDKLTELEFSFVHYNGCLVDFKGCEHSFTLEITEIENKLEGMSSKYGTLNS